MNRTMDPESVERLLKKPEYDSFPDKYFIPDDLRRYDDRRGY